MATRNDKQRLERENKMLKKKIEELYNAYRRDTYELKNMYNEAVKYYNSK